MSQPAHIPVQQGYDRWSEVYDTDGNPLFVLEEPVVHSWLGDVSGQRVADVGCGTGRHTRWLAEAGAQVVAFDFSAGMMSRAWAKAAGGRVQFCRHALPEPLPLRDSSCRYVLFALVADHVEQLEEVFSDFHRVLAPGGTAVFTVLHPAMNLAGVTARFLDPDTGEKVWVAAFEHSFSDYLMAVLKSGLQPVEIVERVADEQTASVAPRADKYLGWPMLLAIRAVKAGG